MAIPPFVNGVLPPGTYPATIMEVETAFDRPGSSTRLALNVALRHVATLIWSRDPTALIYVNGSYATDKREPLDVDVAVRSDVWDDTLFSVAFSLAHPGEVALADVYFNPKQSLQHMEELFREIQGSSARKGIVQLLP